MVNSGAPWPTDRPSVGTTGIPMFTLTFSSYFGSPGESWLHINVVINWQLSKPGIRWPVSPYRIAGSGVDPSRSSIFWSYPLTIYFVSNDRRLTFTFFFNSYQICCVYISIAPHYYDFDFKLTSDAQIQPVFLKYRRGRPFLTMVTCWSRPTSNFYALIGQNLTGEFMRKIYAASWKLFTLTAEADRVLSQLVMF